MRPQWPVAPRRIGLALSQDRFWLCLPEPRARYRVWSQEVAGGLSNDASELAEALQAVRDETKARAAGVWVTLLPPLAQMRTIDLPRMSRDDLRTLLMRDVNRYFLQDAPRMLAAGIQRVLRRGTPPVTLAAAAPTTLVEGIHAVMPAGWRLEGVYPAASAWAAAAMSRWKGANGNTGTVSIRDGLFSGALTVHAGVIVGVRKGPREADSELPEHLPHLVVDDGAGELAARYATRLSPDRAPMLAMSGAIRARAAGNRRAALVMSAAAALILATAAGVEMLGARRHLRSLTRQRASLAPAIARAISDRDAVNALEERLAELARLEAGQSDWTQVLAVIGDGLPRDAYLEELRAAQDSVTLSGTGTDAAAVLQALRGLSGVAGIKLNSPIERLASAGTQGAERYSVTLTIAQPASPKAGLVEHK